MKLVDNFKNKDGFSLVEITIAIGIISFALLALLGLLPTGLNTVKASADESIATNILTAVAADVRNIPEDEVVSEIYGIQVWDESAGDSGTKFLDHNGDISWGGGDVPQNDAGYVLQWKITRPPATSTNEPVAVHLAVLWPAQAAEEDRTGSFETLVVLPNR